MMNLDNAPVAQWGQRVLTEVERAIIGKTELLTKMIAAVLVPGGHLLLEDYPGLAKTLIARSFATVLGLAFKRIQFTPDLLPGDVKKFVRQTLLHRLILDPELWMPKRATDEIISQILQTVPVPVAKSAH
jgi:MoxR-like ATPase